MLDEHYGICLETHNTNIDVGLQETVTYLCKYHDVIVRVTAFAVSEIRFWAI